MTIRGDICICIWKMSVQLENTNSYVILLFTPKDKLQMQIIKMNENIINSREAISSLFGLTSPDRISISKPSPTLKEIFETFNPFNLFNPKYIPSRAILPKNYMHDIFLCYEVQDSLLRIGLILDKKVAIVSLTLDSKDINTIVTLIGQVCLRFFFYRSVPEDLIASLKMLSDLMMAGDISFKDGEISLN